MIPTARSADHFGFVVPDLEQAVTFCVEVLGAEEVFRIHRMRSDDDDGMARRIGVHPRASVAGAMLRLGPTANLELLNYTAPDQDDGQPAVSDVGAGHLALFVDDMSAAVAYVRACPQVPWSGEPGRAPDDQPHGGLENFFFTTPWGMLIELVSYGRLPYEDETEARAYGPTGEGWEDRPS